MIIRTELESTVTKYPGENTEESTISLNMFIYK